MISQRSIEQVFDAARIEEVVGEYVQLKRSGSGLGGLCPFHNEKTPSFKVNPALGIYKCFGCSRGGNAVDFVMELEKMSYPEAIRHLASRYQIELEETYQDNQVIDGQAEHKESLYVALEYAKKVFHDQLLNQSEGKKIGLSYFKERGLTDETILAFNLGYAMNSWDSFLKLPKTKAIDDKILLEAGLIKKRNREGEEEQEASYYDAFRERVIFPIANIHGKTVGFGARQLVNNDKSPKYLNSPESEVYHKSSILYGLYESRKDIRIQDRCLLVEGYMDVVMLHQHGVKNVVASSGTSLTPDQVKLIKRFTDHVTILYDGDKAGIKAALRGIDLLLEGGLNAHVVLFPEGEDPDSYCKLHGGEAFKSFVAANQKDFVLFKAEILTDEYGSDPIGKSKCMQQLVESIILISDPIKRQAYIKELARLFDFEEQILINESVRQRNLKRKRSRHFTENDAPQAKLFIPDILPEATKKDAAVIVEKHLLENLMLYANEVMLEEENITVAEAIFHFLKEDEYEFKSALFDEVFKGARQVLEENQALTEQYFVQHPTIGKMAAEVYTNKPNLSHHWTETFEIKVKLAKDNFKETIIQNINYLRLSHVNESLNKALNDLKHAENEEEVKLAQIQYQAIRKLKDNLHVLLGIEGALPSRE